MPLPTYPQIGKRNQSRRRELSQHAGLASRTYELRIERPFLATTDNDQKKQTEPHCEIGPGLVPMGPFQNAHLIQSQLPTN
jgi:hypothetical protein